MSNERDGIDRRISGPSEEAVRAFSATALRTTLRLVGELLDAAATEPAAFMLAARIAAMEAELAALRVAAGAGEAHGLRHDPECWVEDSNGMCACTCGAQAIEDALRAARDGTTKEKTDD